MEFHEIIPLNSMEYSAYVIPRFHIIFYLNYFHLWDFTELSEIKTYGITWKYSVPFQGGAEGIWWNFHSIPFQKMEWNGPQYLNFCQRMW